MYNHFCQESVEMVNYPAEAPIEAISVVVSNIRNKSFTPDLAQAVWNVQGYAMRLAFGDAGRSASQDLTNEQAADMLQASDGRSTNWRAIAIWAMKFTLELLV